MEHIPDQLKVEFLKAKKALMAAEKIVIISHRGPDGDAIGANLALKLALERLGKKIVSACVDPIPENSLFLEGAKNYVIDFEYEDFDVIVSVDCGALKLVQFPETKPEILNGPKPFINFDHHESNNNYGTINPVDPQACATCLVLYKFFEFCEWRVDVDMSTCLLHGIYFDTGSLMHSNATEEVFRISGKLVGMGANLRKISKELFHTTNVNKLRLWGKIMERTYVNEEGVTISAVGMKDYASVDATPRDTGGVIDLLNSVPGSKYCVLLSEDDKGLVKGSLRTQRDDVNLSEVAGKWGGGGHPKASGFGVEGKLKPVMSWKIVGSEGESHALEF